MTKEHFIWCEKYRPKTIQECILPQNIKDIFLNFIEKQEIINMLFCGPAGTGKTTAARALCEQIGCDYIIVNCSDETGVDNIRQLANNFGSTTSFNKKVKVIILDEADYLSPNAQAALRNIIESLSMNCRFILTCNFKHKLIKPLHSRTSSIDFNISNKDINGLKIELAKRILNILQSEKIEYNKDVIFEVIKRFYPDNRRIIMELQKYANITGEINSGIISIINNSKMVSLINFMKANDFTSVRQWIADNPSSDELFTNLYENISHYVDESYIPVLVLILGDYQFKSSQVANTEINMAAAIVEIMKSVKFK